MFLMDGPSFAVGGGFETIIGFIAGFILMAIIVTGKRANEMWSKVVKPPAQCPFTFNKEEIGCMECGNYTLCEAERVGRFEKYV